MLNFLLCLFWVCYFILFNKIYFHNNMIAITARNINSRYISFGILNFLYPKNRMNPKEHRLESN
jgi:hypothetical protein